MGGCRSGASRRGAGCSCLGLEEPARKVRDLLRVGHRDLGIDLVVEAIYDGKPQYRAVQCKLYATAALGHADLATFTSDVAAHPSFEQAIIASNAKSVTLNFDEAQGEQSDKYTRLLDTHWTARLDGDFWARLHAALRHKTKKSPRREPKPHQKMALAKVAKAMREGDRAKLIMACGTGKTLTAYLVSRKYRVTGWFVPSLHLEKQVLDEVRREDQSRGIKARYLAIGSDASVIDQRDRYDLLNIDPRTIQGEYLRDKPNCHHPGVKAGEGVEARGTCRPPVPLRPTLRRLRTRGRTGARPRRLRRGPSNCRRAFGALRPPPPR